MGILQELITGHRPLTEPASFWSSRGTRGDETAELITNLIGVNALRESEIRNVLSIIRSAFAKPQTLAPGANYPARSLKLLEHLADFTGDRSLRQQISETREYLQAR
jgi:hypothetical protein